MIPGILKFYTWDYIDITQNCHINVSSETMCMFKPWLQSWLTNGGSTSMPFSRQKIFHQLQVQWPWGSSILDFLEEYKIAISWMDILLTWNKTSLKRLILVYYHYVVWGHTIKLTVINTQFVIGRHKEYPITLIDRKRTLRLAYPFGEKKFFYSKLIHFRKTLIQHQDIIVSAMYHFIINS